MKNKRIILAAAIISILLIASVWAIYSNQKINVSAKNSSSQSNISVYVQNESNLLIVSENLSKDEFVINDKEIVIKNLTIPMSGLTTDEKIFKLKDLNGKLPSFVWLSADEKQQAGNLINRQYQELQQNSDYHRIPAKIVVGNQNIDVINGSDYNTVETAKKILALFPSYDIKGIKEINFSETPVNNKSGQNYPMYYFDGKIFVRPDSRDNWFAENGGTFMQGFAHEVGHNIIDRKIADPSDLERFFFLHGNVSSPENFLTKYASEKGFEEDFSESASFWRGNTPLFCKISRRNSVMQEKFLIIAKQFCRDNLCTVYVSLESEENGPSDSYTSKEDNYRGLFLYDMGSQNIKIENIGNFSGFSEKLNCK